VKLVVHPGPPLAGRWLPPGDKSITHRAVLLGLLAGAPVRVTGANPGADCASSLACAGALGAVVEGAGEAWSLTAPSLVEPAGALDCGNSGTTLRLFAGLLAAQPFRTVLTGDGSLVRRPVDRIIVPLRMMGASLKGREGDRLPPLEIRGAHLRPIRYRLPIASAQVASCILIAGLSAAGETEIEIPGPARDHTERMLSASGVALESQPGPNGGRRVSVGGPQRPRGATFRIPGDFSAAAFFLAAAAATPGAEVTATSVGLNPSRTGFLDVLEAMGAPVSRGAVHEEMGEPVGDVTVRGPASLRPFDVPPEWVPRLIDEAPAWAVVASAAPGRSRLTGASELRVKESDRIALLARNLGVLGLTARELPDGLEVEGGVAGGGRVESGGDHRIAMAFAALGTRARGGVTIDDATQVITSYPGFARDLAALGGRLEPEETREGWA
jgi:3-phosphoshikimate 1-carboxyvinyltransferase